MAEIKSAIELAMEKTSRLGLSKEDKEKLREEEIHSRAQALVNRFLSVEFHLRGVERELEKCEPPERRQLEELMVRYLAEALRLEGDNELAFEGIEALRPGSRKILAKIQRLSEEYRHRKEKEHLRAEDEVMEKLEARGISGSALLVRVEGSPEWEKKLDRFRPEFEGKLKALKEELKGGR